MLIGKLAYLGLILLVDFIAMNASSLAVQFSSIVNPRHHSLVPQRCLIQLQSLVVQVILILNHTVSPRVLLAVYLLEYSGLKSIGTLMGTLDESLLVLHLRHLLCLSKVLLIADTLQHKIICVGQVTGIPGLLKIRIKIDHFSDFSIEF